MSRSFRYHLIVKDRGLGRQYKALANRAYRHKVNQGKFDEFGGKSNKYRFNWNSYDIHDYIWRYDDSNLTDLHSELLREAKCK